ncbi:MAG: glycosyltransferase family A protein [Pseudomonadota bacterium]
MSVAAIVIGRNEGARLLRCLESLEGYASPVIYVDSGSTDGSAASAARAGVLVVELDMATPFTAARARNVGLSVLPAAAPDLVQLVDGDCELLPNWFAAATSFLSANPRAAAVAGRLRERTLDTVWSRLADAEWNVPPGKGRAIGGIAMVRRSALTAVGDFRADLAQGEEPELSRRLEIAGWEVWRISDEMALHDIAMTHFSQWWRRTRRGGYAAAEAASRKGDMHQFGAETRRALLWGLVLPASAVLGALLISPWMLMLLFAWPLQVLRLKLRGESWERAFFLTLGKLPEALGVLAFRRDRILGGRD